MDKNHNLNNLSDFKEFTNFICDRITELRLRKNVSEYQMSLDLGQNRTYIQNISSKRALPSMGSFYKICKYFDITPAEFFTMDSAPAEIYLKTKNELLQLPSEDVELIRLIINRFIDK